MQRFADIAVAATLNYLSVDPDVAAMTEMFGPVEDWMLTPLEARTVLEMAPVCPHPRRRSPICQPCATRALFPALIRKIALRRGLPEEEADAIADEMVRRSYPEVQP